MSDGVFEFENCLLKHHIRSNVWLPLCKQRLQWIREASKKQRRLRYFTFCAVGALDVLMLERNKIIRRSEQGRLDSVCFFDYSPERVDQTIKRIPGAMGLPGNFLQVVLADDPVSDAEDTLSPPSNAQDTQETRSRQILLNTHRTFRDQFPFDVLNLDLEGYLFRPNDRVPGRLVRAMRRMFDWQKRTLKPPFNRPMEGFTLFLTTKIGPPEMGDEYLDMLRSCLGRNMERLPELSGLLSARTGVADAATLERNDFEEFFKLASPKLIASIIDESDWYVEPEPGLMVYEFERRHDNGSYRILHIGMQIRRKVSRVMIFPTLGS